MAKIRNSPVARETSIQLGNLFFEDAKQCSVESDDFREIIEHRTVTSIRVISLEFSWVQPVWIGGSTFDEKINCEMTLRSEQRCGTKYWYAYRRVFGKLHKRFVGQSEHINQRKLVEIARKLPSK